MYFTVKWVNMKTCLIYSLISYSMFQQLKGIGFISSFGCSSVCTIKEALYSWNQNTAFSCTHLLFERTLKGPIPDRWTGCFLTTEYAYSVVSELLPDSTFLFLSLLYQIYKTLLCIKGFAVLTAYGSGSTTRRKILLQEKRRKAGRHMLRTRLWLSVSSLILTVSGPDGLLPRFSRRYKA